MSAKIVWSNDMATLQPQTIGRLPKKPVIWIGEIWFQVQGGERDIRSWRSNNPITKDQARTVLCQLLDSLIGEHGKDSAVSSGFWCKSR
jgi:hypothetical protein